MSADNGAAAAVLDDSINNIPAPPPITKEEAIAAIKTRQEQRQAEIAAKRQQRVGDADPAESANLFYAEFTTMRQ
eukprot:gene17512-24071_t